ncbi:SFT2-like protein [Neoconidiobolus thromboides FSU 785]|nr:SFT2-like protein [Neoconidiobolus thromboides FSU 785]
MPLFETDSSIALQENPCSYFNLTWEQRMYGFLICFIAGFIVSILSVISLSSLNIHGFAILYCLGNILCLLSSMFLIGFARQLKMMTAPVRLVAFIIYIVALIVTLVMAIWLKSILLTIILMIIQFLALLWYCASYVPFARRMIKNVFSSIV